MKKGFVKLMMLRLISREERTGYGLMKKIGEITGKKPSTGTIYPLLKSMEAEGWITGVERQKKTYYSITEAGTEKLEEVGKIKSDFLRKITESVSLASEAFEEPGFESGWGIMGFVMPVFHDVVDLKKQGVSDEEIRERIKRAREELMNK